MNNNEFNTAGSPVMPQQLTGEHVIQFNCHKEVGCFNACCQHIDITLTPYDILRLRKRLGLSSREFLMNHAVPFEFRKGSIAGLKLRTENDAPRCLFVTEEGCSVYEDRPTACRYYPVGLLSMRKEDEYVDRSYYALVKESHCLGHQEDRKLTIDEYRKDQGLDDYDELARGWRQLVLKVQSSGPTIGAPSKRSLQLFFMACYDHDAFRVFVLSDGFQSTFELEEDYLAKLAEDDVELMLFGFRFIKQVMFGEQTIPLRQESVEQRNARRQAEFEAANKPARDYDPAFEPVDIA